MPLFLTRKLNLEKKSTNKPYFIVDSCVVLQNTLWKYLSTNFPLLQGCTYVLSCAGVFVHRHFVPSPPWRHLVLMSLNA